MVYAYYVSAFCIFFNFFLFFRSSTQKPCITITTPLFRFNKEPEKLTKFSCKYIPKECRPSLSTSACVCGHVFPFYFNSLLEFFKHLYQGLYQYPFYTFSGKRHHIIQAYTYLLALQQEVLWVVVENTLLKTCMPVEIYLVVMPSPIICPPP